MNNVSLSHCEQYNTWSGRAVDPTSLTFSRGYGIFGGNDGSNM